MIVPVRCFSCGKPVAKDWEEYVSRTAKGEDAKKVLDSLGYERYCCRRMFLAQCELVDTIMKYKKLQ
jgi:DNA-directed RNA polymerase subunit N